MTTKTVRVTLELPPEFLSHLHTNQQLEHALGGEDKRMTASQLVARLVYLEARGATEEQIHVETPMEWRQGESLAIIHDERRVYENGKQIAGPFLVSRDGYPEQYKAEFYRNGAWELYGITDSLEAAHRFTDRELPNIPTRIQGQDTDGSWALIWERKAVEA